MLLFLQNGNKKGQAISIDLLIGTVIFMIALAIAITIWSSQNSLAQTQLTEQEMEIIGTRALNYMVTAPGETPQGDTNWQFYPSISDNVRYIGLADNDRQIDKNKLAKFVYYGKLWPGCTTCIGSYFSTKQKILLMGDMNFYFRLYYLDNSANTAKETIIEEPVANPLSGKMDDNTMATGILPDYAKTRKIISIKRIVFFEGTKYSGPAIAELQVYN